MTADYARTHHETSPERDNAEYQPRPRRHRRMTERERRAQRRRAALILYGLPALGLIAGIFATYHVMSYMHRHEVRDYGRELRYSTYEVQPGDTLWGIAVDMAALNPEYTDVRQYLSALQAANHIYGDFVQAGTEIQVPYYATPAEKMRGGESLEENMIATYAKYDIIQYDKWFQILDQAN